MLLNDDHNLVLAGAGSGKTSVLTARVSYLLQSHLAKPEQILLVAFARDAAQEMAERLKNKIGLEAERLHINTFHQLGLRIINRVEGKTVIMSPLANDSKLKQAWCIDWLKRHWMTRLILNAGKNISPNGRLRIWQGMMSWVATSKTRN